MIDIFPIFSSCFRTSVPGATQSALSDRHSVLVDSAGAGMRVASNVRPLAFASIVFLLVVRASAQRGIHIAAGNPLGS